MTNRLCFKCLVSQEKAGHSSRQEYPSLCMTYREEGVGAPGKHGCKRTVAVDIVLYKEEFIALGAYRIVW